MSSCCGEGPNGINVFIYFSHMLSAWGDRMWSFGVGLFLININPESLQLSAVYGLFMNGSVLLFGSLVGHIVDRSPRLRAAQTALVLQNLFVMLCAIVVYLYLKFRSDVRDTGSWAPVLVYGLIILLSILSTLTSMARKIAVANDWIVQICGSDFDMLATMTATLRRIDLATQILAPIATGFVMSFIGVEFGALFIGGWNIVSVVFEYYLLWKVYNTVPSLKKKKDLRKSEDKTEEEEALAAISGEGEESTKVCSNGNDQAHEKDADTAVDDSVSAQDNLLTSSGAENVDEISTVPAVEVQYGESQQSSSCLTCCEKMGFLKGFYLGWPVYVSYSVLPAGLSLALLYMTVLGFDSITIGYIKLQGVSEAWVGLTMGIAAAFGILGTLMYPVMRSRLGLVRTGMYGLSTELACLCFCVASVFVYGSPFDLTLGMTPSESRDSLAENCTQEIGQNTSSSTLDPSCSPVSSDNDILNISVIAFLAGIITARFGLWVADLSISQIYFETVAEHERGKVGGVQTSLNQLMDMFKFGLVVLLPYQHQFGLLIFISFTFIFLAVLLYAYFLYKNRGHFFHFEKCLKGCVPELDEAAPDTDA